MRVGGLGRGLGFVQGQTVWLRLGQSFLLVRRVRLLRVSRWVVLGLRATSTEGCSVGTKWWRTMTMIASKGNFDLLLRLDRVGTGADSTDREIALRVCSLGVRASRRTPEVRRVSEERRLNSTMETKRDPRRGAMTLVYLKGVSSRSKLEIRYRKCDGLYREERVRVD